MNDRRYRGGAVDGAGEDWAEASIRLYLLHRQNDFLSALLRPIVDGLGMGESHVNQVHVHVETASAHVHLDEVASIDANVHSIRRETEDSLGGNAGSGGFHRF